MSLRCFSNISISRINEVTDFVGPLIRKGSVIGLTGGLGAGKTYLTSCIFSKLGIEEQIVSPTFTIMNQYYLPAIDCAFYHFEVYRINGASDLDAIGFFDAISETDSVIVVEWAEKIREVLPEKNCLFIEIKYAAENAENRDYSIFIC